MNPAGFAPIGRAVPDFPLVSVGTSASGFDSRVSATFDNVAVNGVPFDDFSGVRLDASKWSRQEVVREIQVNRLHLSNRGLGRTTSNNGSNFRAL